MASILNWNLWTDYAWTGVQNEPLAYAVGIESSNYAKKRRTCVAIKLSALGDTIKRNTLTLQLGLSIQQYSPSNIGTRQTIGADLTKTAPSSTTYKTQGTIYASATAQINHTKVGATPTINLTFDISRLSNEAQTVYVYVYGLDENDVYIYYQYKTQSGSVSEQTASAVSAVTTGTITSSTGQIFLPSGKVTVNWTAGEDKTNNKIASYTAYLRVGSAPTATSYTMIKTGISSSSTSYTFTLDGVARGSKIWVGIQAIGTNSNYSGAVVASSNYIGIINSLPSAPTVKPSGSSLTYTSEITYTVTSADNDSNQETTLYYSIGSGGKNKITNGSLTISLSSSFKHGSNTLNFYAYDGLEYSSASSHTFTASFNPIIKSGTPKCTHTKINNMNGSAALVTSSRIEFSMSGGSASGVTVKVRQGASSSLSGDGNILSSSYYSYSSSTKIITIDITKIPTSVIGYGNYFDFSFTVTDGSYTSSSSGWLEKGRRPKLPNKPTLKTCTTDTGATTANSYFKKAISVNWSNPSADEGCAAISSTQLIATYGSSTASPTITSSPYNLELSSLSTGTKVTLRIKIIDMLGNTATSDNSITFIKTDYISFLTQTATVSPTTYHPYTSESTTLVFTHPNAKSQGGNITYTYFIQIGSNKKILDSSLYSVSTQGEQKTLNISNSQKKNLATLLESVVGGNNNNIYSASFIVIATDGYGDSVDLSRDFKVEFREAPVFNNSNFDLRHDYKIGRTSASPAYSVPVPRYSINSTNADKDLIMFNSGEGLIFQLPKATDPNNDIDGYQIFISQNILPFDGTVKPVSSVTFKSEVWLDIPVTSLTSEGSYYYYRFNTSPYSINQYFYFKVRVKDRQGNYSALLTCDKCIIGCRTTAPKFSVSNLTLSKLGDQINFNYELKITDLGGSATDKGWNQKFYLKFRNYERDLKTAQGWTYTPTLTLYVDISHTPNFSSYIRATQQSTSNLYNFTSEGITFTKPTDNTSTWNEIIDASKVYARFRIQIAIGISGGDGTAGWNYVNSSDQNETIFMAVPTVAHRVNAVGINTKTIRSNEVLVIENFKEKKYVILRGTEGSASGEIIIDLTNGTISGVAINCGSW